MSKYIDAVGLKIKLGKRLSTDERRIMEIVKETINSMPTIDIVRCKDCKFAKPTNTENVIQCTWLSGYTFRKDHYCSAGERIDNE